MQNSRPSVSPEAYVAPSVRIIGDVRVDAGACVLDGTILSGDRGLVHVGPGCVVMENCVLRGTPADNVELAGESLIGPHAYLTGCSIDRGVFLATGAVVMNGAKVESGAIVRIHGTVHIRSRLKSKTVLPIGWIAIGDPAVCYPPEAHDEIFSKERELDFLGYVFNLEWSPDAMENTVALTRKYARGLLRARS